MFSIDPPMLSQSQILKSTHRERLTSMLTKAETSSAIPLDSITGTKGQEYGQLEASIIA